MSPWKRLLRCAAAALAAATFCSGLAPITASASDADCTKFKCTRFTNYGSLTFGVVYGRGAYPDVQNCWHYGYGSTNNTRPSWKSICARSYLAPGATSVNGWDADAVVAAKSCTVWIQELAPGANVYWVPLSRISGTTDPTFYYYKLSSNAQLRVTC